jgi:hypothetical protein
MRESLSKQFLSLLQFPIIARVRRNHGLEHATLNILASRYSNRPMGGHSDINGFWIVGNIETEDLRAAVGEALQRLRAGEHRLAVHPNCGTNFATGGVLAGSVAALSMFGAGRSWREKIERLPMAITLATLALILAQPLGLLFQERVTTSGDPGDLEVVEIIPRPGGRVKAHRVLTHG